MSKYGCLLLFPSPPTIMLRGLFVNNYQVIVLQQAAEEPDLCNGDEDHKSVTFQLKEV